MVQKRVSRMTAPSTAASKKTATRTVATNESNSETLMARIGAVHSNLRNVDAPKSLSAYWAMP